MAARFLLYGSRAVLLEGSQIVVNLSGYDVDVDRIDVERRALRTANKKPAVTDNAMVALIMAVDFNISVSSWRLVKVQLRFRLPLARFSPAGFAPRFL